MTIYTIVSFNATGIQVRLRNGTTPSEGRVEVLHDDIWGTICRNNFDVPDAKVICRMLGYLDAYVLSSSAAQG